MMMREIEKKIHERYDTLINVIPYKSEVFLLADYL